MTKYDVRIEPMPDNPVREERGLGRRSGFYRLEIWERDSTGNFQFKLVAKENFTFEEAQTVKAEMINSLNARPPAVTGN
jgi:hypothetical protein